MKLIQEEKNEVRKERKQTMLRNLNINGCQAAILIKRHSKLNENSFFISEAEF